MDSHDAHGIMINPETARKKGIKAGDRFAWNLNSVRTIDRAVISETIGPGVVTACAHYGRKNPVLEKLAWASVSETERIDLRNN